MNCLDFTSALFLNREFPEAPPFHTLRPSTGAKHTEAVSTLAVGATAGMKYDEFQRVSTALWSAAARIYLVCRLSILSRCPHSATSTSVGRRQGAGEGGSPGGGGASDPASHLPIPAVRYCTDKNKRVISSFSPDCVPWPQKRSPSFPLAVGTDNRQTIIPTVLHLHRHVELRNTTALLMLGIFSSVQYFVRLLFDLVEFRNFPKGFMTGYLLNQKNEAFSFVIFVWHCYSLLLSHAVRSKSNSSHTFACFSPRCVCVLKVGPT